MSKQRVRRECPFCRKPRHADFSSMCADGYAAFLRGMEAAADTAGQLARAKARKRALAESALPALDAAKAVLPQESWAALAALVYVDVFHEPDAKDIARIQELAVLHGWPK